MSPPTERSGMSIHAAISDGGGFVCEEHPWLAFPHDDCDGPGMLRADAVRDGLVEEGQSVLSGDSDG